LLIHLYIFVSCALLDVDVASVQDIASVQRRMPHGNDQVNWVSYSLLCKHIHVLCFLQNFEQRKIIFVIHRSLNILQNAVEYLHNKSEKKRWQKNTNVSCSVIYYGEHFVLGVAVVYLNPCTADSAHYACVLTTLFCLRRLREAVVLRVKVYVFFSCIGVLKLLVIFLWMAKKMCRVQVLSL